MALGDLSRRQNQRDRPLRGLFRIDDGSQPGGQSGAQVAVERIPRLTRPKPIGSCPAAGILRWLARLLHRAKSLHTSIGKSCYPKELPQKRRRTEVTASSNWQP